MTNTSLQSINKPALPDDEVWKYLDLLLHLAVSLQSTGQTASGTLRTVHACAANLGLDELLLVCGGRLVTVQHVDPSGRTFHRIGKVGAIGGIDCERLKKLESVSEKMARSSMDVETARQMIDDCMSPSIPPWWDLLGLSILAFCIALQVGTSFLAAFFSAVIFFVVALSGRAVANIPQLYGVAIQCVVSSLCAIGAHFLVGQRHGQSRWHAAASTGRADRWSDGRR